jgi:hypothetical protein
MIRLSAEESANNLIEANSETLDFSEELHNLLILSRKTIFYTSGDREMARRFMEEQKQEREEKMRLLQAEYKYDRTYYQYGSFIINQEFVDKQEVYRLFWRDIQPTHRQSVYDKKRLEEEHAIRIKEMKKVETYENSLSRGKMVEDMKRMKMGENLQKKMEREEIKSRQKKRLEEEGDWLENFRGSLNSHNAWIKSPTISHDK